MFIDTHAHYFDRKYEALEGGAESILESADFRAVTRAVINVGTNLQNSRTAVAQAGKYPFMAAAVGIHPEDAQGLPDGTPLDPETELKALREWLADPAVRRRDKIVAIGEIGLDYYWVKDEAGRQKEADFFRAQMELARELDLPVIVHDREAHGDTLAIVKEFPDVKGVFHCYSGSVEMARELVDMGWMISLTGVLTYKNARRSVEVVEAIPLDRLMIETDSPYMAPVPHRGKRNDSGYVLHVCEKMAEIKGISVEECAAVTMDNGKRFFRIP